MKLKFKIIALTLSLLIGCNLDEKIYDTNMAGSFIQSNNDALAMINGVYSTFLEYNSYKTLLPLLITYSGDDIAVTSGSYLTFANKTLTTTTSDLLNPWKSFYNAIGNTNLTMEALTKAGNISESFKNRAMAELHFLRGFCYFNLVRLFRGVPIYTEAVTGNSDFYPPRSTVDEVYALIFSDLEIAAQNCLLYSEQPEGERGHATKGAAQAFLSLAYLTYANYKELNGQNGAGYYQIAENYADSVIQSNQYSLATNYASLWDVNQEKNSYKEVIFGLQFTRDATTANAASRGSDYPYFTQPNNRYGVTGYTNRQGSSITKIQPWFYDLYNTGEYLNDYRTEISFLTKYPYKGSATQNVITYPNIKTSNEVVEQFPYMDKYRDPNALQARNSENDFFIIRLAEVYLIKAEAENELNGPTTEAYAAFNKLRERARLANGVERTTPANLELGLSKEGFRLKIFNERGLELVGEGHRWFDAVRMRYTDNVRTMMQYRYEEFYPGMTNSAPTYDSSSKSWKGGRVQPINVVSWNPKFLIWPIPGGEIDLNPNLTQNSEWE